MNIPAPPVRKTSTRLADGRALHYFDDSEPYASGRSVRALVDARPAMRRIAPGHVRIDSRTGDPVVIASGRARRTHLPPPSLNPLAPSAPGCPTEIPAADYDVVVFDNRFPSLPHCEVVCYSPDPAVAVSSLPPRRMRTIIEAWADRTAELSAREGVRQVFCFENRGPETGVTLTHPHGQIYAYPFIPPDTEKVLRRIAQHRESTGGNLLRDRMRAELASGTRVVLRGRYWAAYVPEAARWPVEVELAPLRDATGIPALDDDEREELAHIYPELLRRLDHFYEASDGGGLPLPYIASWHQAPTTPHGRHPDPNYRLHLRIHSTRRAPDRLKHLAASETAMGAWVNPAVPEEIAARLRDVAAC